MAARKPVITLAPPVALGVVGRRVTADDRSWRLLVFVPGESARTHLLDVGNELDDAQDAAAALLGREVTWTPTGTAWRAE